MSLADQSQQWYPTSVKVTVLQARNLRIKGKNGTNDAYAIMQVAKDRFSTAVAEKCVSPVWKEEASFDLPLFHHANAERCSLRVTVMHRALVGLDKQLGQAAVNLLDLNENRDRSKTEWFKLLDKNGKEDKERGEVLLDIQFTRNNMTASMFDLSSQGKSRSRMGKLKDKIRGKKDGFSDSASAIVPASSPPSERTDSEGEDHVDEPGEKKKKKSSKLKSLFVHKSNLQRNVSQSMSTLGSLPEANSSLSGSRSSGLNLDFPEGKKKKFKFLTHKRTGSSDSKAEQSGVCINGSHVYEEAPLRGSTLSLRSSEQGSVEDLRGEQGRADSPREPGPLPPRGADEQARRREEGEGRDERWMFGLEEQDEKRAEEEHEGNMVEEDERKRMEVEQETRRVEEEQERKREERKRREEEQKMKRLEEEEEMRKREEQERKRVEEDERKRREEEQETRRVEEEQERKREERERKKREEEQVMRRLEEEEEMKKREEQERKRVEEDERKRLEEEQEMRRMEKEQVRKREEQERKMREDEQEMRRLEEEMRRLEEEAVRKREEQERKKREEEQEMRWLKEEQETRLQEEQARKKIEEELEIRKIEEEQVKKRNEQEMMWKEEEQERNNLEEQERKRKEEEQKMRRLEEVQEMRKIEEEQVRNRREDEQKMRRLEEKEEMRKIEEEQVRKREEQERTRRVEEQEIMRLEEEQERNRMEQKMIEEKQEKRKLEEELVRKREEQERKRREEEQEVRRLEEEQEREQGREKKRMEEARKEEELRQQEEREAELKGQVELSVANPFRERSSSNPFLDISSSSPCEESPSTSLVIRSARVSAVKPRLVVSSKKGTDKGSSSFPPADIESFPLPPPPPSSSDSSLRSVASQSSVRSVGPHVPQGSPVTDPAPSHTEKRRRAPLPPYAQAPHSPPSEKPPPTQRALPALPTRGGSRPPLPPRKPKPAPSAPSSRIEKSATPPKPAVRNAGLGAREERAGTRGEASGGQPNSSPEDASLANPERGGVARQPGGGALPDEKADRTAVTRQTDSGPPAPETAVGDNDAPIAKGGGADAAEGAAPVHDGPPAPSGARAENSRTLEVGCRGKVVDGAFPSEEKRVESVPGAVLSRLPADAEPSPSGHVEPLASGRKTEEKSDEPGMTVDTGAPASRDERLGSAEGAVSDGLEAPESGTGTGVSARGGGGEPNKKKRAPLPPERATDGEKGESGRGRASQGEDRAVTPPVSEPQRTAVAGRRRAPQPGGGAVSGVRTLLRAWVSPSETQPMGVQGSDAQQPIAAKQSSGGGEVCGSGGSACGPTSAPRRPHPVKPLSSLESHPFASSPGGDLGGTEGKTKVIESVGGGGGPYSQLTQSELASLVVKQQGQLSQKDNKIKELEEYIDNLLVRIIEEQPSILQSLATLKKGI